VCSNAGQLAQTVPRDPIGAWLWAREELDDRREHQRPPCPYQPDTDWEARLHGLLGVPSPSPHVDEFRTSWVELTQRYKSARIHIGRGAFAGWGDGEPGMIRAVWTLIRQLHPENVVETGVARGFTSRMILDALERNRRGRLWSIDLPPVQAPELHAQIGSAVDVGLRHRWTYMRGTSRQRLPKLLRRLGEIDLFIHDSRHTERNVKFELDHAWAALRPGGAIVADDIVMNWDFDSFKRTVPGCISLTCYAEPLQPDPERAVRHRFKTHRRQGRLRSGRLIRCSEPLGDVARRRGRSCTLCPAAVCSFAVP
jgi:hypothetical protein